MYEALGSLSAYRISGTVDYCITTFIKNLLGPS